MYMEIWKHLQRLLEKVGFGEDDVLFFVGDMLEKGPRSLDLSALRDGVCNTLATYTRSAATCEGLWQFMLAPDHRGHLKD